MEVHLGNKYLHIPTGIKGTAIGYGTVLSLEGVPETRATLYNQELKLIILPLVDDIAWIYEPTEK